MLRFTPRLQKVITSPYPLKTFDDLGMRHSIVQSALLRTILLNLIKIRLTQTEHVKDSTVTAEDQSQN